MNDDYLAGLTADGFDWRAYIARFDPAELKTPQGRRKLTYRDPLLFALLMLPRHLKSDETGNRISFSDFHLDLCRQMQRWVRSEPGPAEMRDAFIAPRGSGKSSWLFLILPLWALAHGHRRYIAAFADSASQAEQHLTSLKRELDTNTFLRRDYPDLCTAAVRKAGVAVSDNRSLYIAKSGAVFSAKGIDSSTLGAKIGSQRPDLLLFDDVEPDESNYSLFQKDKRLSTIVNAVFPMNDRAIVLMSGTVTMPGSIFHDLALTELQPDEPTPGWITDEKIRAHHYPALITDDDGSERSCWPQRWSLPYLQSIRHTRSFAMNFQNNPLGRDGDYWSSDDFTYSTPEVVTHTLLSIDPAITSKATSDFTGLAVVGYSPPVGGHLGRCVVKEALAVRLPPAKLRERVLRLLDDFPEIALIVVEANQGGDTWLAILHDMPCKVSILNQSVKKEVRAAAALNHYQRHQVTHAKALPAAEAQMVAFPKAPNDDLVDAVGTGVLYFLDHKPPKRTEIRTMSYT